MPDCFLDNMHVENGNSGAAKTINVTRGSDHSLTLTANCVVNVAGLVANKPTWCQLTTKQGGGGTNTISFVGTVTPTNGGVPFQITAVTPGGTGVPLTPALFAEDIISIFWNGTKLYTQISGSNWA